jgi:hypothetical protein
MSTSKKTESTDHEIYEVTIGASLSTGAAPTTEITPKSIAPKKSGINLGECEHPYQVEDLNLTHKKPVTR